MILNSLLCYKSVILYQLSYGVSFMAVYESTALSSPLWQSGILTFERIDHLFFFVVTDRLELPTSTLSVWYSKPTELRDHYFRSRSGTWTRTGITAQGILSPSCLPVPPFGQLLDIQVFKAFY